MMHEEQFDSGVQFGRDSESHMHEEGGEQQLFISEYTYSDEDTQYDRRRALERHSSTDVTDIPIVKLIENQLSQSENEANKPIVSYVSSFFRATATSGTTNMNMNWLSGTNSKRDQRKLNIENFQHITESADVVEVLNNAVEQKNSAYTIAALDLVTTLCEQDKSKTMSVNLGGDGVCSVVEHLLGLNINTQAVTESALRAICSLITPISPSHEVSIVAAASAGICTITAEAGVSSNRRRFSSAGSVYQIVKAANNHISDEIVLEWGLRVLFYLSLEQGLVTRIITCGGCDLLAQALRSHSGCDDIVVWSCRTLCNCILTLDVVNAQDRTVCQDKFAQQLVLEILVSEFAERLSIVGKLAAQWSLKAIGCLARRHEMNVRTFVELGVCELLQSVQRQFSLEDEKIAESVCWVIGNVSYPAAEAQQRWGACGACEVVLSTLKKHVNSEETVQEALRALRNLCFDNQANLELLRGLRVAEIVMSVIRRHQESSGVVLQWLWYAVAALAEYRPLVLQLGEEDVCVAAVASITRFSSRPDLVQWTALAIAKLASELKLSVVLGASNCCAVLVLVLSEHRNDEDVVEEIFSAIACLSANCIDNRANFHRAGAEAAMLKAITKHEKNDSVVEAGLTAIANMIQAGVEITSPSSEDSSQISHVSSRAEGDHLLVGSEPQSAVVIEKIVNALVKADGCKVIAKAVLRHASQYRIAEMGCKALSDIGLYGLAFEMRQYSEAVTGSRLPHRSLKSISIECITNRAQVGTSTKLEERILLPLGQSSAPAALVAVLQNYMNDPAVAQWALLALDRIATCNRNIPILHSAGIDALLVLVLQTHFVYHPTLVNLCYRLITHFAVDDESRAFIGTQSGGEVLLISLAHNMSTTLPAKLGSDAISSLCISPEYDAIALMASKDSYGPSYDELDANQRTAEKNPKSQKFEAFTKPRSRSNSGEHDAGQSSEEAPTMSRTLSALFSWQAAATAAPPSPAHSSTPLKSDKAATIPKVVTTFELMSKKGTTDHSAATGGLLGYASGAFISKGLTDQEEEMHTAKAMARSRKSNSSVLITNGVTTILLTIMDLHGSSYEVQIAAANALNSLALDPVHRNELNHESIFDSVVKAFRHCMCTTTSSRAKKTADMDESLHSLDGSGHGATLGDVGSIAESSLDGAKIAESMTGESAAVAGEAEVEDDEDKPARRVLLVILSICIGTLCLPLAEELEGLKSNQEHFFAAGNQNYLGRLNTCELLVECLRVHARDSLVCEGTLRAIYYLSRNNEANQLKFGTAGVVGLVMAALRTFFFKPHVVYYCCMCIGGLSHRNVVNADQFDDLEVADLLFKTLTMYMETAEVVEAACYAIYALKDLNHRLGDVCKLVVTALNVHIDSVRVNQFACQAIGSLCEFQANKEILDRYNVCGAVTSALQRYVSSNSMLSAVFMKDTSNAAVAQWGCTAIYYIARGSQSQEYQHKLVAAGACEAVTKALLKYSEYETISHACFRSLVVLLMNNGAYKSKLGALGVCGCVVESMHMFPYSAQVAKWGCRAVAVLAESHEANIARLGVAGACESIPVILQAHPSNEYVASAGCDVISFMSETLTNGFAARFGQAGGCEAVVSVLRKHSTNAHVVTRASIAVASLSRVKGNATWMGPSGACDALMTVLQVHQADPSVAKFIISAMGNLCIIDNNRERLGTLGACESIVNSARQHIQDLDTAKAAALSMGKLCKHIYRSNGADESLMHNSGAGSAAGDKITPHQTAGFEQSASGSIGSGDSTFDLLSYKHNRAASINVMPNVSDEKSLTFQSIAEYSRKISPSTSSSTLTAAGPLSATKSSTPVDEVVSSDRGGSSSPVPVRSPQMQMSPAALAHANAGRRNRARLFDSDYCAVLVSLISHHITDADAVRIISRTISIIAFGDACNAERDALAAEGACKALAKALQFHEGDESIGRGVCWAIKALAYRHHRNREALRKFGTCGPILLVLRGFRYSKNAAETVQGAAAAIANMCQDNLGNKSSMGLAGACEGLLEVIELHYRNIEVAYLCTKALFHVCDGNHENRLKISFSGAADILMNLINRYADEDRILDYIFSIMVGMCLGKVGQSRLGTVGVGKATVSALYRYEKSSEYLVLLSCTLIHSLAHNSTDNQNKLGAAGACKAIAIMASRYVRSQTFLGTNMRILEAQALPKPASTAAAADAFVEEEIEPHYECPSSGPSSDLQHTANSLGSAAEALPLVSKDPLAEIIGEFSVLKECCKAVVYLAGNNEANRAKFQATPLLDILTPVLSTAVPFKNITGPGAVSGNISAESLRWVKSAVDVLMGKA